jgi:DNA-binding CsgD family transcriptional regulator
VHHHDSPHSAFASPARTPPAAATLSPTARELLAQLTSELAKDEAWGGDGSTHVHRDHATGVRVTLERVGPPTAGTPGVHLSARELQIAQMIAAGHSNKTIGYELGISIWTVSTHLRRIFAKLGVRSRAAMVGRLAELQTPQQGEPR